MATKDTSLTTTAGAQAYQPFSPLEPRANTVDLSQYTIGASGADTVNLIPLAAGEVVLYAFLRVKGSANAGSTLSVADSRTGGGAVIAASASDAAAGTIYKGAGAAIGAVGTTAGYLTLTTGAAVAVNTGKVDVFAVILKAF